MKLFFTLLVSTFVLQECVAPPVTKKKEESEQEVEVKEELPDDVEYRRYLEEVIYALESDPDFRDKLEKANETDIRNGKIADELEFVNHRVRTKLDELKRAELERLRHLAVKEFELENGLDTNHLKIGEHVDHTNPHTFEIYDLKKLIAKTTKDLDEADKRRREEFKQYEMNKKFEQEEKMKKMSDEEKKKFENELHDLEKKHKDHEPLHHPGSKKQLEEVWKKQDNMEYQQFDPKTFFYIHDIDGNGVWDQNELKTLFLKELDKLYAEGHPEDDLVERAEELERMREHVIREADVNKDGLISYEEFLNESKKAEFEKDPGWEPLDEQQLYSEQEYEEYKRQKARELEQAISQRMLQENLSAGQPQAGHQQFPPHPNQLQQEYMHQQQAQYHQQVPGQPQQQHYPQQGQYMNQMPPHQGQFNQLPPQQGQYQVPPQHIQYNQMPPQPGQLPNQMPPQPGQLPNQMPPQQGQLPNQMPAQPGQLPNQMPPQPGQLPNQVLQAQGQLPNQMTQQQHQSQQYHPNQQIPAAQQVNQHINQVPQQQQNYPSPGHQVPPQQQFQQPPVMPNPNQIPQQQQFNVPPGQQLNQQQNINSNSVHHQVPQQIPSQQGHLPNQHPPAVTGQNQNTQNQIPQQTHEQVSSVNNNAQGH